MLLIYVQCFSAEHRLLSSQIKYPFSFIILTIEATQVLQRSSFSASAITLITGSVPDSLTRIRPLSLITSLALSIADFTSTSLKTAFLSLTLTFSKVFVISPLISLKRTAR